MYVHFKRISPLIKFVLQKCTQNVFYFILAINTLQQYTTEQIWQKNIVAAKGQNQILNVLLVDL